MNSTAPGIAVDFIPQPEMEIVPTIIPAPAHAEAKELLAYWQQCESRGGLKLGRDIPTREIAKLMSKLSVLEPVDDMRDFVFRLVGSGWLKRFGRDIKGERISSLYADDNLRHYVAGLTKVIADGKPNFIDVRARDRIREHHHIEYAQFPVLASNSDCVCVLTGAFYF